MGGNRTIDCHGNDTENITLLNYELIKLALDVLHDDYDQL